MYWEIRGNQLEICTRQEDRSVDDPADVEYAVKMIGGGIVRAEGWMELARRACYATACSTRQPPSARRSAYSPIPCLER